MKRTQIEPILIATTVIIALAYTAISFWPSAESVPEAPTAASLPDTDPQPEAGRAAHAAEAEAVATLIRIGSAELSFHGLKKRFGSLSELAREGLLSSNYSEGVVIQGYRYSLSPGGDRFAVYADPVSGPGRHLFIDETLDLRCDENGRASPTSPFLSFSRNTLPSENKERPIFPSGVQKR
jgi:hypothetical protein